MKNMEANLREVIKELDAGRRAIRAYCVGGVKDQFKRCLRKGSGLFILRSPLVVFKL
ncbi:MAG: reverse gyrase [Arenicella sp.]|jgi:reverse gyrase